MRKHNNLDHRSSMLHCVIANLVPHCALRFAANLALESGPHHEAQPSRSPELHVPSRFVCKGVLPLRGMANKFQWAGDLEPMNPCGFLHPGAPCATNPTAASGRGTSEGLLPHGEPRARNSHGCRLMGGLGLWNSSGYLLQGTSGARSLTGADSGGSPS